MRASNCIPTTSAGSPFESLRLRGAGLGRHGAIAVANYDTVYGSVGATVKPELNTAGVSPDVNKIRQIIRSNFIAGRVGNEMSQVIAETGNQQWVNHVIENAFYSDKITNLTTTVTPPSGLTDGTLTIQFEIADYNLLVGGVRVFKLLDSMISKADKFTFNRTVITPNDRAADNATIFYYGNGTEGFGLFHTNGGLLKLKVTSGSADNIMSVTGAVVGDGKWHNLILTRVAAAANSARWKLWVDGVEHKHNPRALLYFGADSPGSRPSRVTVAMGHGAVTHAPDPRACALRVRDDFPSDKEKASRAAEEEIFAARVDSVADERPWTWCNCFWGGEAWFNDPEQVPGLCTCGAAPPPCTPMEIAV
eukprot:jgi/Mesvir1/260/Mv13598-RA.1